MGLKETFSFPCYQHHHRHHQYIIIHIVMMLGDVCDDGVSSGALRWELVKLLELAASEPHLSGCSPSSTVVIIIMVSQDHHRHS